MMRTKKTELADDLTGQLHRETFSLYLPGTYELSNDALIMSVSQNQTLRHSNMLHELKEILLGMEKAHKADIQTYSSGHLGPHGITYKPLNCGTHMWNKTKHRNMCPGCIRDSSKRIANMEETAEALYSSGIRTTPEEPWIQKTSSSLNEKFLNPVLNLKEDHNMTELTKLKSAIQEKCGVFHLVERDNCVTNLRTTRINWSDPSHPGPRPVTQIIRSKNRITRKWSSGNEAAKRHEYKLQQALRKLPACGGPSRERLTLFSDLFNDVCDGSPAFGTILRDIKTEYDLYLTSLLSAQLPLQDKSLPTSFNISAEAGELKEAIIEVFLLEQEAKRSLEENNRVQKEFKDAQDQALLDQKAKMNQCNEMVSPNVTECELSYMAQIEAKRRQVWNVWNEVQKLEKDIRETMVSTITTGALENCIRDSEDEILNLAASSVFLQRSNKDLERNISATLRIANIDERTTAQVWEEIWTTLNGSHTRI